MDYFSNKHTRHEMSPELKAALERARNHVMTPEEKFEQRVSFVYGQQDYDDPNPKTKDEIRQMLIDAYGYPSQGDRSPKGGDSEAAPFTRAPVGGNADAPNPTGEPS